MRGIVSLHFDGMSLKPIKIDNLDELVQHLAQEIRLVKFILL